jgi:NIPSNAP
MTLNFWKSKYFAACASAMVAFAAGSLITGRLIHANEVKADSNRVFELRVYHALPGKLPALESRFRDKTSKILARHNVKAVGYWVAEDPSVNSFIWIAASSNQEEEKRDWGAVAADPEFQQDVIKAEQAEKTVEKVDLTHMRPTDFSAIQ